MPCVRSELSAFRLEEDAAGPFFRQGDTTMEPLLERPVYLLKGYDVSEGGGGDGLRSRGAAFAGAHRDRHR